MFAQLTEETQRKISNALAQLLDDLEKWLQKRGLSEQEIVPIYEAAVRENGLLARFIGGLAAEMIPLTVEKPAKLESFVNVARRIRTGEFSDWLLTLPEPSAEQVRQIMGACRNALATVRHHLTNSGNAGPQLKRGGRHKELDDPETRLQICEEIKRRRGPGSNLGQLFTTIGKKHNVSATTIKRIWSECQKDTD